MKTTHVRSSQGFFVALAMVLLSLSWGAGQCAANKQVTAAQKCRSVVASLSSFDQTRARVDNIIKELQGGLNSQLVQRVHVELFQVQELVHKIKQLAARGDGDRKSWKSIDDEIRRHIGLMNGLREDLGGQMHMLKLQSQMSMLASSVQLVSNMIDALSGTEQAISDNIKGDDDD